MTYQKSNNSLVRRPEQKIFKFSALGLLLILAIFFAARRITPDIVPALFTTFARPFWRAEFSLESGSLSSRQSLLALNEHLKLELSDSDSRLRTIQAIEEENRQLKSLLGRNDLASSSLSKQPKRILAPVLARPGYGAYDELIIDGGNDLGFAASNKVYAPGNIMIGYVSDVLGQTSKVTLFSSPEQTLNVLIGSSSAPALAVGRGGGQYSAELPRSVNVSPRDFVVAPTLEGYKPFGTVFAVENDLARAFETVLFAPPVNIYELRWVLVEPAPVITPLIRGVKR